MHARTWTRCLAQDAKTGAWCQHRPSHGVFCSSHAWEFQCDEAAKAATRLARARLVLRDPSATPLQQWWAALQARRARSLRRSLLGAIAGFEDTDADIALAPESHVSDGWNERRT
jgi:hypothetical protein